MTRIQINFRLRQPLNDELLAKLSDTNVVYGIQKIKVAPDLDSLMVEYDATRLRPAEVEAALAGAGIAVEPA
jgi:hypothetical protein